MSDILFPPNMVNPAPVGLPFPAAPVGSPVELAAVVNPAPPGLPEKRPPASPEEFEQRKSEWTQFIEGVRSNPQLLQSMITTGTRLMQGPKPGQSDLGTVGEAIQAGTTHYQMLEENATKDRQRQQELDQRGRVAESQIEAAGVARDKARQDMEFEKEAQPTKIEAARNNAKTATLKLKAAELEMKVSEALDAQDPTGAERARKELKKVDAELARINAAAAASGASAAESRERTRNLKGDTDAEEILANPKSTPEQRAAATARLQAGRSGIGGMGSAQVEMLNAFKANYLKMNPAASESDVAKAADAFLKKRESGNRIKEITDLVNAGVYSAKEGRMLLDEEGLLPGAGQGQGAGKKSGNTRLKFDSSGNIIKP